VVEESTRIDYAGQGVSGSAILTNTVAHEYFERYSTFNRKRPKRIRIPDQEYVDAGDMPAVKRERDIARARQRYMRMTKQDLVQRLIAREQAYAEVEERWHAALDDAMRSKLCAVAADQKVQGREGGG